MLASLRMKPRSVRRTRRRRPRATIDRRATRAAASFARLVRLMDTLRSPRGCPWDRKQTHRTLRPFLLEEAYEALDAIDRRDFDDLAGELGDVLFQCVFHAQLAAEAGRFEIADAIDAITAKLVRRHPHVFTPAGRPLPTRRGQIRTSRAVVEQWEQLKARERGATGAPTGILDGIPRSMAALLRAHEIGSRVGAVGFDWPRANDVLDKIDEEVRELRAAAGESDARAAEELGDLLFSIANLARKLGVEPESALREANDKFTRRFALVERALAARGRDLHDASLEEMEAAWQRAKRAPAAPSRSRSTRAR
jgi:MazG family protein